jgi:hypothetical protein
VSLLANNNSAEAMSISELGIVLNALPADPTTSTVALSSSTLYIGHTVTATLQAKDSGGVNITSGGETVVIGSGGAAFTVGATTDNSDGTYTATVTGVAAGSCAVTATIGGVTVSTTIPAPTIIAIPTATATATGPGTNFYAGRTATVTLTTPNAIGGLTVVISGGAGTVSVGTVTDVGNGTYTATATAIAAGTCQLTGTMDGVAISAGMPVVTVPARPAIPAGGPRGGALCYGDAASVAKWSEARQYALRFGLGAKGRWQRFAVVHGATAGVTTSDVNYFALYALFAKAIAVKTRTDTF